MSNDGIKVPPKEAGEAIVEILNQAVKPHAEQISRITGSGDIAIVVFELFETMRDDAAASWGWDGVSPVFRLSNKKRKDAVEHFRKVGDQVSERWFRAARNGGRIFLLVHGGTFLLNITDDGLAPEPGSLDAEGAWKS